MWCALAVAYFVPSIVAFGRQHHNRWSVFVVNFFLGWCVIGWIVALAMAASSGRNPDRAGPDRGSVFVES